MLAPRPPLRCSIDEAAVHDCSFRLVSGRSLSQSTIPTQPLSRAQAFVSVNWVLAEEPLDLATELGLEFLDFLLVRCTLSLLVMLSPGHVPGLAGMSNPCLCVAVIAMRISWLHSRMPTFQNDCQLLQLPGCGPEPLSLGRKVGTSAAPLRKSLMDSGLGQALIGGGLQGDLRQPIFSIGLKGVDPADAAKARAGMSLLSEAFCLHPADHTF